MFLLAGLALAGFGGAGLAARNGTANVGTTTGVATTSSCTKAHPCSNPACTQGAHGPGDCTNATTATIPTTSSTTVPECTRANPCANPGCTQAGHGPLDCYDVTTTTATTSPPPTTTTPSPGTTTTPSPTTNETTTAPNLVPPAPPTTTTTTTSAEPTTTAETTTRAGGTPGAPFLPPPLRTPHRRTPSTAASPVAGTLPYTGANLTLVLELALGLLGAGLVLVTAGRWRAGLAWAGMKAPARPHSGGQVEPPKTTASEAAPPGKLDYRLIIPGVGAFSSVAEADSYIEERNRTRRRSS